MTPWLDPIWIAEQLMLAPADLLLIPFGTTVALWLVSRLSYVRRSGLYAKRASVLVVAPRFALGFMGGLAFAMIALWGWTRAAPIILGTGAQPAKPASIAR